MRKKRIIIEGAAYHVTSRTNAKVPAFENRLGRKIILITLENAKEKYGFRLHNFCIMPTHIHLLITPNSGTNLSRIMQWIKTHSAKRWNCTNNSKDHLWGERFFARQIKDITDYLSVKNYIDQNPVNAGLVSYAPDWEACGAYYIANGISGFVER
jgi:putative transposase